MLTLGQILNANFPERKAAEKRLAEWLRSPRKLICPYCFTPFKALVEHDADMFDVLCPDCSELT